MTSLKPIHTLILDAGPILRNDPSISTLLAKSENIVTVPPVIAEIKDVPTRTRVETMLLPFLIIKNPSPQSVKFVTDFARKTGDLSVLSKTDLSLLALAYELECEKNGGDWRLRKVPGQKGLNGPQPKTQDAAVQQARHPTFPIPEPSENETAHPASENDHKTQDAVLSSAVPAENQKCVGAIPVEGSGAPSGLENLHISTQSSHHSDGQASAHVDKTINLDSTGAGTESSDSEGWITPSNLKKHQSKDLNATTAPILEDSVMQVATITTDFAMQNVLLQIGLNLLSPALQQVRTIKTYVLRCHACFQTVKEMTKQFCPRCGKSTLNRVSCSVNRKGEFKIHLKKNMQWDHRGDRYSIPKPVPGSANGKTGQGKGGGKGGWGQELILAEDQKEYLKAVGGKGRRETDLMDDDYLPSILTGDRGRAGGRPKVGAGRNVNSKKRI